MARVCRQKRKNHLITLGLNSVRSFTIRKDYMNKHEFTCLKNRPPCLLSFKGTVSRHFRLHFFEKKNISVSNLLPTKFGIKKLVSGIAVFCDLDRFTGIMVPMNRRMSHLFWRIRNILRFAKCKT